MVVAHGHIIQYIHKIQLQYYINTHAHYQEFIVVKFLRGLVVIAISQLLDLRKNFCQLLSVAVWTCVYFRWISLCCFIFLFILFLVVLYMHMNFHVLIINFIFTFLFPSPFFLFSSFLSHIFLLASLISSPSSSSSSSSSPSSHSSLLPDQVLLKMFPLGVHLLEIVPRAKSLYSPARTQPTQMSLLTLSLVPLITTATRMHWRS